VFWGDKRGPVTRPGVPDVLGERLGPGLREYRPREAQLCEKSHVSVRFSISIGRCAIRCPSTTASSAQAATSLARAGLLARSLAGRRIELGHVMPYEPRGNPWRRSPPNRGGCGGRKAAVTFWPLCQVAPALTCAGTRCRLSGRRHLGSSQPLVERASASTYSVERPWREGNG
jgi:hypothetical protein